MGVVACVVASVVAGAVAGVVVVVGVVVGTVVGVVASVVGVVVTGGGVVGSGSAAKVKTSICCHQSTRRTELGWPAHLSYSLHTKVSQNETRS